MRQRLKFKRAEAIENLESYARVIVVHLALLAWFPGNNAKNHWQAEINAFIKTLRRYDKGEKRPHNFSVELISEILEDEFLKNDDQDAILIGIEGHGVLAPERPDFKLLAQSVKDFAEQVIFDAR
jgi:hypothetical protein